MPNLRNIVDVYEYAVDYQDGRGPQVPEEEGSEVQLLIASSWAEDWNSARGSMDPEALLLVRTVTRSEWRGFKPARYNVVRRENGMVEAQAVFTESELKLPGYVDAVVKSYEGTEWRLEATE